jgi:hypothetical protein
MTTKKKIFIAIGASGALIILLVLGAIAVGGTYVYKKFSDPVLAAKLSKATADGSAYGAGVDQDACMQKGFTLEPPVNPFDNADEKFVDACLHASRPSPDFCNGVPFILDLKWFHSECEKVGHDNTACYNAFVAKRNFCKMDTK